ncbi:MAG: hypothetical protein K0V04_04925 [Deltaproteobacteria bacterium]|nr:hypothetical protein [Deltaproteobacteria bacterium]
MSKNNPPPVAAARKHVLLGLLATAEHERLALPRRQQQLDATTRWIRARFDLLRPSDVVDFLPEVGLSAADFADHMRTLHDIARVQEHYHARIDQRLPRYRAVFGAGDWLLRQEQPVSVVERWREGAGR